MNCSPRLPALAALVAIMTAGCGGGGGGGSSASVSIDRTAVAVSAVVTDATVSTPTVTLTILNVGSNDLYVAGQATSNGVSSLSPGTFSGLTAQIQIFLKTPYTLAPATYTDNVVLKVCVDRACTQQISGSPLNVRVSYTISAAPAGSAPTMTVSTNALSAQALPTDSVPPRGFQVTIAHAPSFPLTARVTQTSDGVASTAIDPPDTVWNSPPQLGFNVDVTLKSPSQLSAGVHTDQVTVEVCLDPNCVNPLAGGPQTVTITYQIGNGVPGSYTVAQVPLQSVDMVADNKRAVLYAAVPASAPTHANSLAVIDPSKAVVTGYIATPFDPGKLAISDDGSYLYIGEHNGPHIARFLLPAMTLDTTIVLANDGKGQMTWPIDIKVQPGSPKTIAVARDFKDDTAVQGDGIVIYDDTSVRPQIGGLDPVLGIPIIDVGYLSWGSTANTLYGSGLSEIGTYAVSPSGADMTDYVRTGNVFRIRYAGGILYADSGTLFDPASLAATGSLTSTSIAVTADTSISRVYELAVDGLGTVLYKYDSGSLAGQPSATFLHVYVGSSQYDATAFTRWGTEGLAFLATDQQAVPNAPNDEIVLVSGSWVTQ
jgi:hypothetical protein